MPVVGYLYSRLCKAGFGLYYAGKAAGNPCLHDSVYGRPRVTGVAVIWA